MLQIAIGGIVRIFRVLVRCVARLKSFGEERQTKIYCAEDDVDTFHPLLCLKDERQEGMEIFSELHSDVEVCLEMVVGCQG